MKTEDNERRTIAMAARFARGRVVGGSVGRALIREELERWRSVGFVNPERLLDHHWPGFGRKEASH